jgi:hypothetical protein
MDLLTSNLGLLVTLAGFLWLLLAAAINIRVSRGEDDPVARWRYRERRRRVPVPRPARRPVGPLAARRMSRLLIAIAIFLPIIMFVAWSAQPGFTGGPMFGEPPWYQATLPWAAAAVYMFGLGWMIRIYRADPEPDRQTWRYRAES